MGDEEQGQEQGQGGGSGNPDPDKEYALEGMRPFFQVSPEASYWAEPDLPILHTVTVGEVLSKLEHQIPEYPEQPTASEIKLLTDTYAFARSHEKFSDKQQEELGEFLTERVFAAWPPAGITLNNRARTGRFPIVLNGAELATMFEAEKTAVWHQHVLLTLLDLPIRRPNKPTIRLREIIPPPLQALMQSALHMATLSALSVMWRFKWRAFPELGKERRVARRERPAEYFARVGKKFDVLYDYEVRFNADGDILRNEKLRTGLKHPGTPRHPAYGSGHSVYAQAASEVLIPFLPKAWGPVGDIPAALRKLANAIGIARIWGGVHWEQDHRFSQKVGTAIAGLIMDQLNDSLVDQKLTMFVDPPSREVLEDMFAKAEKDNPRPWRLGKSFPLDLDDLDNLPAQGGRVTL